MKSSFKKQLKGLAYLIALASPVTVPIVLIGGFYIYDQLFEEAVEGIGIQIETQLGLGYFSVPPEFFERFRPTRIDYRTASACGSDAEWSELISTNVFTLQPKEILGSPSLMVRFDAPCVVVERIWGVRNWF